jgi:hypothetical protein
MCTQAQHWKRVQCRPRHSSSGGEGLEYPCGQYPKVKGTAAAAGGDVCVRGTIAMGDCLEGASLVLVLL